MTTDKPDKPCCGPTWGVFNAGKCVTCGAPESDEAPSQRRSRRLRKYLTLGGLLAGWWLLAFWTLVGAVVYATAMIAATIAVGLISIKTIETVGAIRAWTNSFPETKIAKFILHNDYVVSEEEDGSVKMEIPEEAAATFGQWRIERSTNLIDWTPGSSLYTDQESADTLAHILFATERKLDGDVEARLFYRARKDVEP